MTKPKTRSLLVLAILVGAVALPGCWGQSITASVAKTRAGYVRINEPVVVNFSQKIDLKSVRVALSPATDVTLEAHSQKVLVTPTKGWQPAKRYALTVKTVRSSDHSVQLDNWTGRFDTQPRIGIAGFLVDGRAVTATGGAPTMKVTSTVTITFASAMKPETAPPTINDQPVPAAQVSWAAGLKSVDLTAPFLPSSAYKFGLGGQPETADGDVLTDLSPLTIISLGFEPSNGSSGITPDYKAPAPLLVVIDNAGDARPQSGLQAADMAYEYISEYSISRFTLMYFANPEPTIGPVRSCRMINTYLLSAFHGIQMCSGASVGTLHYLFGDGTAKMPLLATSIDDFDRGNHFFRVSFNFAPHNLYTDSGRALRLRQEVPIGGGPYTIDIPHPDNGLGTPAGPPSIPLHGVSYSYDAGSQSYRPFDHGTPRIDTGNRNQQLLVKNVVLMHVPYAVTYWVEDENGGAHSIWYYLNGSGPAEVWSDGKLVHATWHQGSNAQNYFENTTQPVYFTDESGNLLRLNTGLTWVHVVGNGQTS